MESLSEIVSEIDRGLWSVPSSSSAFPWVNWRKTYTDKNKPWPVCTKKHIRIISQLLIMLVWRYDHSSWTWNPFFFSVCGVKLLLCMRWPPPGWCQRCHSPPAVGHPGWSPVRSRGSGMKGRWKRWRGAGSRPGRPQGPPSVELLVHELGRRPSAQRCRSAPSFASEERRAGTHYAVIHYQHCSVISQKKKKSAYFGTCIFHRSTPANIINFWILLHREGTGLKNTALYARLAKQCEK